MPIAPPGPPRTIADLLLDERATIAGPDDDTAPPADGLPQRLSATGRAWVRRQVTATLEHLLGASLADVLTTAWAHGGDLARAARETADDPTAERLVLLHQQQVTYVQDLTISIVYDEAWPIDFQGRVTVVFDLGSLEAIVRGGDLVSVIHGHCAVIGSLELEGNLIARRLVPLPVDITLDFPGPVSLVRREDRPQSRSPDRDVRS